MSNLVVLRLYLLYCYSLYFNVSFFLLATCILSTLGGPWQNMQLLTDARAARMYRDELDAMKERAIRADKLESEVARYRDKLHNMNFYKTKLEVCVEECLVTLY